MVMERRASRATRRLENSTADTRWPGAGTGTKISSAFLMVWVIVEQVIWEEIRVFFLNQKGRGGGFITCTLIVCINGSGLVGIIEPEMGWLWRQSFFSVLFFFFLFYNRNRTFFLRKMKM